MKKFLLSFLFFFPLSLASNIDAGQQDTPSARPPWFRLWEKAKGLEHQGSYLEARKIYESLLANKTLGPYARSIQKEYESLEIKILLSPIETPDALVHVVAVGDTLSEIAKKYGTTVELLRKSNGISGDKIYPGMKLKVTKNLFSIQVDRGTNRLTLFAGNLPLKRYKVATGADDSTPIGTFKIVNKLEKPTWFHGGAVIPPGHAGNILGSHWLGFDAPGYGIHGTTLPDTIGTHASKGCIRMLNADVEEIYTLVPVGVRVTVKE